MTFPTQTEEKKKAFLISAFLPDLTKEEAKEHLEELKLLVETYQADIVGKEICPIRKYDVATYITKGKLEEMIKLADAAGANLIIFDDEITASQQRNLEICFKRRVIDRTEVILAVFAMRAQTREARLQIELANQKYLAPRLAKMWSHLSRQAGTGSSGGGGAYLKGEGEKQIEIDRRIFY
ncbi:MAG: GTPase HflX, partial [Parachlamydiaceae bacterium]